MALASDQISRSSGSLGITKPNRRPVFPFAGPDGQEPKEATPEGALLVGEGIEIKGGIESCDHLVVEGLVESNLTASQLELRQGGRFRGSASLQEALIEGEFEGDITVIGLLSIGSTAQIKGKIRYGSLSVAEGGRLSGDIDQI